MNTRTSANVRLKQKKQPSRLICAMQESPVAFGVSAGLIVLGFAAGTAVSQGLSGGALAASFFSELEVNVWAGFARSALYNASLAAMVLLMRVYMVFVPVSFLTFAITGAALGFGVGFYIERSFINFDVKCDKWYFQIVKLVVGLAGLLLFKTGLKYVIGTTIVAHTVRYFVIVLWVIALYPLIIKSFFKRKQQ